MKKLLRVLIIEDSENDAFLLLRELGKGNWTLITERVYTDSAMRSCLEKQIWDVIICDYVMPNFSGLNALKIMSEKGLDIPFIIVSGRISEDVAIAAMKAGAHDFVIKGNLKRLIPVIEREIIEAENRSERRKAEEARRQSEIELHALAIRLVKLQEEERRSIARELHDQIGQNLTVIKFIIENAIKSPPEKIESLLKEAVTGIAEVLKQIQDISLNLRPSMLDDLGLVQALIWMFNRLQKQNGLIINFTQNIIDEKLTPEINITVFRIVQEALTNVLRYSGAAESVVRVWMKDNLLSVTIEDNGRGFDINLLAQGTSTGLSAMRERAKMLGGTFKVNSIPNKGTRIIVEIPIASKPSVLEENQRISNYVG